jgi:thiamine-monophosphate kinase
MTTLAETGERDAIARLIRLLPAGAGTLVGPGDDCAVVRLPGATDDLLLTSDPVIEGVHFDAGCAPERIGHKAMGRILSDLAAMAGTPCWALIDAVAPPQTPVERLEAILRGAAATGARYGLAIVGGDMAQGPLLELHAFGVGCVPAGRAVLRAGARPGDAVYVTGRLGGSRTGRHLDFEPRVREGEWLRDWAHAMIDVSDGLATDVRHLAEQSGVAIRLELAAVPVSEAARRLAGRAGGPSSTGGPDQPTPGRDRLQREAERGTAQAGCGGAAVRRLSALDHALRDGEDFELLFTVPAGAAADFERAWRERFPLECTRVGDVLAPGVAVDCRWPDGTVEALPDAGFNHFTTSDA